MNQLVRSHKKINQSIINTPNEVTLKAFFCLLSEFNKQLEYKDLDLSKMELWNYCGLQGKYTTKDFNGLVKALTRSETYQLKSKEKIKISGSMFITKEVEDRIIIHIPEIYREYIFNGKDLNLMSKAKKQEKMSTSEIDYYDKKVKDKSKELVLLNKANILGLKGKYNTRLYTLLKQWDSIGKYEKNWKDFKEIMEVPKSYKATDIESRILDKAKIELLKANIEITDIEKVKKGRSIDKIIIRFKNLEKLEEKKNVVKEDVKKKLTPEEIAVEKAFTKMFLKMNGYTLRDLGNVEINNELREFIEENK